MRKILSLLALSLCAVSCIYPYTPEIDEAPEGILSVDANIAIGDVSTVRLGCLLSLYPQEDGAVFPDFSDARVWLEDDAGTTYPGKPSGSYFDFIYFPGRGNLFTIPTENAPGDRKYRLCIDALGARYVSEWTSGAEPPEIKDIEFTADKEVVTVQVSVDGGPDASGYLLLSFDETWEFHADYYPHYSVEFNSATNLWIIQQSEPDYSRYWCWKKSDNNQSFPIDYTAMSASGITAWPLHRFSRTDNRNHRRYCVNVKARTLSKESYRFLKNLESISDGGDNLFTPTPGEIAGNLRCESDPERMVLGYALLSKTSSKRAWLDNRYLLSSPPRPLIYPPMDRYQHYYYEGYLPLDELLPELQEDGKGLFGWGPRSCYDCTAAGGTLVKPSFWDETE